MTSRTWWALGACAAFAAVCALLLSELRFGGLKVSVDPSPAPALAPPQAPPSAMPPPTPGVTNESLHAMMTEEREKMGIQDIGPQTEEPRVPHVLGFGEPGTREQAEAAVKRMILMRKQIDEAAGKKDPVPIEGSVAPVLSQPDQDSGKAVEGK